jgi:serine/threonine-protein phosphatase PP1 catalytic subunit
MPSIDALGAIERPCEVPETGLLCDLVWADPDPGGRGWGENERGTSVTFDLECVAQFCEKFGFDLICRAHQAVMDGYEFPFSPDQRLVTLFSAPNYCYEYDNKGAFLVVDAGLMCTFKLLEPTPGQHPLDAEGGRSGTPPRGGAGQEHV